MQTTDTDQLIDEIIADVDSGGNILRDWTTDNVLSVKGLKKILRTHIAGKLVLDRSKVEEMIEKINLLPQLNPTEKGRREIQYVIDVVMIYLQSLLIPNPKQ